MYARIPMVLLVIFNAMLVITSPALVQGRARPIKDNFRDIGAGLCRSVQVSKDFLFQTSF